MSLGNYVLDALGMALAIELGIIMAILLGWQFTLAEFIGGPIMIASLALLFR